MIRLFDARDIYAMVAMHALMTKAYGEGECEGTVKQADAHLAKRSYEIADAMTAQAQEPRTRRKA